MAPPAPLISVIIPTYNSSGTLRCAVASVLLQENAHFELLVVGDGCTDDSEAVVASFADPRVRWTNLSSNSGGPSAPRNRGLAQARGELIAYLGHDDLWFPWHLRCLATAIQAQSVDLVSSLGIFLERRGSSTAFGLPEHTGIPPLCSPSTWLHRGDLDLGWPERLHWGHEVWVLDRLRARGAATSELRNLTSLKLPAPSWQPYTRQEETIQESLLAEIRTDARALQHRLLLEMAAEVAGSLVLSGRSRYPVALRGLYAAFLAAWRPYRWPLDRLIRRMHRRQSGLPGHRD